MKRNEFGTSDLPEDFALENYATCAKWGVTEWFQALAYRYSISGFATLTPEEMAQDEDNPDMLEYLQDTSLYLMRHPLPEVDDEARIYPARSTKSPIRNLTGADFYAGLFKLDKWDYERVSAIAHRACQRTEILGVGNVESEIEGLKAYIELDTMPAWTIHREANAAQDSFCIEVDLGAPDEYLVKEFKTWLKQIRKDAGIPQIPKQYSQYHFADWHEKRLLPYLDLNLWASVNNGTISLSVLGHALFPDEPLRGAEMRDVESMIRRTIAPQARALNSIEVVSTLSRQLRAPA